MVERLDANHAVAVITQESVTGELGFALIIMPQLPQIAMWQDQRYDGVASDGPDVVERIEHRQSSR
jgi:hypothetical protein